MDDRERYEQGMSVRRAVLGDAHVDRSVKNTNHFNREYQDLITRYAWGEIWSRPGLPRKTRSLLTLSMLVALNRSFVVLPLEVVISDLNVLRGLVRVPRLEFLNV